MLFRFTCIKAYIVFALLLVFSGNIYAINLKSLLMPGKLIEGHAKYEANCNKCHNDFDKKQQTRLCLACHELIDKDIKNHKGFHGLNKNIAKAKCKQCHTDHKGRQANIVHLNKWQFNHDLTDFKLKGKHSNTDCHLCHAANKKYRQAFSACYSCHKKDDQHNGKMGKKCGNCHQEDSWKKNRFNHNKTRFRLKGKHKKATCDQCHLNKQYKNIAKKCVACHQSNDIHTGNMGTKCQSCHNEKSWKNTRFDHNKKTKFKLLGKHKKLACHSCHKTPVAQAKKQKKLGKSCYACHQKEDIHGGRNGKKCNDCHNNKNWGQTSFDHDKTKFPLTGAHKKQNCFSCHNSKPSTKKRVRQCQDCHQNEDPHSNKLGKHCDNCHNTTDWLDNIVFDHDLSQFPLTGMHISLACESCHLDQQYKNTQKQCYACHKEDDIHQQVFGEQCEVCHNPNDWNLWTFNHNLQTDFKLENSHKDLKCDSCHRQKINHNHNTIRTCYSCHKQDDQHDGAYGHHCSACHNTKHFYEYNIGH